jgi:hypothetical protein
LRWSLRAANNPSTSYGSIGTYVSYGSDGNDGSTFSKGCKVLPVGKAKNAPGEITLPPIDKFPEQLHRDVKAGAAQKGISMKEFFLQALRFALKNDHVIRGKAVVDSNNESGQKEVHAVLGRLIQAEPQKRSETKPDKKRGPKRAARKA